MKEDKIVMTCATVSAIDGELAYQSEMAGTDRADTEDYGVPGQLVTLAALVRQAEDTWYSSYGNAETLHMIRKIAATAVRALEMYGCPERILPQVPRAK